jgi:REP element-mobilizing transposase RayT
MRKPRQLREGAKYHVSARANRQEMILRKDAIKDLFLDVVKRAKKKYAFKLENFCVMENHFHLVIQPSIGVSLSVIMRWIMSVFAMTWNRRHGLNGHVWGERFFSRIIQTLADFLQVLEYIDLNPVAGGLVRDPAHWRFGGCWRRTRQLWDLLDPLSEF